MILGKTGRLLLTIMVAVVYTVVGTSFVFDKIIFLNNPDFEP
jgi:hypothetical protein